MLRKLLGILTIVAAIMTSRVAAAQTFGLAWDPVTTNSDGTPITDLQSYVVYRGVSAGVYNFNVDVGNVTASTQTAPLDCTNYFFAIKAKDTSGNQSATYSNEVSGYARVAVTAAAPASLTQGRSYTVTLTGTNFQAGVVTPTGTGLTVGTPTIVSCTSVTVPITVAANATLGTRDVEFMRTGDRVFGTALALLTITADTLAPAVPTNVRRTEAKP